ncbi:MAG: MFS transporter [Chloroflexi bacterium]|nr:MFS transporter [Chloroflexota bacterium]
MAEPEAARLQAAEPEAAEPEAARLEAARRRALRTLFAGVALGSTGYIAASTIAAIAAELLSGSAALAGLPAAAVVVGSALGSAVLAGIMVRRGRRFGLTVGYLVGAAGAAVAMLALVLGSFPLFLGGTFLMGTANSANLMSRYAAAAMVPSVRRGSAVATVVWGATVGAVVGPNLGTFVGGLIGGSGHHAGLPERDALVGVYLVPLAFVAAAAVLSFLRLRPDPSELAVADTPRHGPGPEAAPAADGRPSTGDERVASASSVPGRARDLPERTRDLLMRPAVATALLALIAGQVVMVLIMTMTPLHMTDHGHDIGAVGLVISGHVFGMYALSPVTGRITDRLGALRVAVLGPIVLAGAAVVAALAPPDGGVVLFAALFLIGYGWNLGFVAGSAMLASSLRGADRTRLEGTTDALIWGSSAVASLGSGVMLEVAGFTALCLLGLAIALLTTLVLVPRLRAQRATGAAAG